MGPLFCCRCKFLMCFRAVENAESRQEQSRRTLADTKLPNVCPRDLDFFLASFSRHQLSRCHDTKTYIRWLLNFNYAQLTERSAGRCIHMIVDGTCHIISLHVRKITKMLFCYYISEINIKLLSPNNPKCTFVRNVEM